MGMNKLRYHMSIHTGVSKHVCVHCNGCFTEKYSLTKHEKRCKKAPGNIQSQEPASQRFIFPLVEKPRDTDNEDKSDIKEVYMCSVCQKLFNDWGQVELHMRVHNIKVSKEAALGQSLSPTEEDTSIADSTTEQNQEEVDDSTNELQQEGEHDGENEIIMMTDTEHIPPVTEEDTVAEPTTGEQQEDEHCTETEMIMLTADDNKQMIIETVGVESMVEETPNTVDVGNEMVVDMETENSLQDLSDVSTTV